jgi:hypothetical protein
MPSSRDKPNARQTDDVLAAIVGIIVLSIDSFRSALPIDRRSMSCW